ncbi:hypothetical protein TIFTF001_048921 [Ficus carica]|uniref:Uncharacterized protein n=1 Tax=Ficus carica TaxID=3494 RepID=A0AA87YY14_FICCA|nr:hypothetical protein TIFTF001_048921 [Ficus carica]
MAGRQVLHTSFSQLAIWGQPYLHQTMLQQPNLERGLRKGNENQTQVDEREKLAKTPTLANPSTPVGV